jgi:hypothetical protein
VLNNFSSYWHQETDYMHRNALGGQIFNFQNTFDRANTPATYIFILILVWKGTRPMYYQLTAGILILILNSGVIGNLIEIRLLKKFSVCLSILISSQALSKVFWKLKIWPPSDCRFRGVGQDMKQTYLYLWYPLFQAQWDRCYQRNHQT